MPTLLIWKGYRFLFYSKEIGEPPHVHVLRDGRQLKVWLDSLAVARNAGFAAHEVNEIVRACGEHLQAFLEAWNDHFGH